MRGFDEDKTAGFQPASIGECGRNIAAFALITTDRRPIQSCFLRGGRSPSFAANARGMATLTSVLRRHVDRHFRHAGELEVDGEVSWGEALFIDVSRRTARFINHIPQAGFRAHDISSDSGPPAYGGGTRECIDVDWLYLWDHIRVELAAPRSVGTVLEHRNVLCDVQDLCRSTTSQQIERNASPKEWLGKPQEIVQLPWAPATKQPQQLRHHLAHLRLKLAGRKPVMSAPHARNGQCKHKVRTPPARQLAHGTPCQSRRCRRREHVLTFQHQAFYIFTSRKHGGF